jgi:hypothetical protein
MAAPPATLLLTGGDGLTQVLVLGYVVIILMSFQHILVGLVFTLLTLLAQASVYGEALRTQWIDMRILGAPVIAVMVIQALRKTGPARGERGSGPRQPTSTSLMILRLTLPVVFLLGLTSLLWSVNPAATTGRTTGLFAAAVLSATVARTVTLDDLTRALSVLGWLIVAVCIAAWYVMPSVAIEQARLRGVFENANGFAAFLAVVAPVLLLRLRRMRWPAGLVLALACMATGSRAGCIALGAVLLIFAMAARGSTTRVLCIALTGTAAGWLVLQALKIGFFVDPLIPLFRNTDSRSEAWAYGLGYFHAKPYLGAGMGALPSGKIGGFVPESLATVGTIGTVLVGVLLIALLMQAARGQAMFMALVLGGLLDAFFEPWLFVGGSMTCVLFWVVVLHPDSPGYTGPHLSTCSARIPAGLTASRRYSTAPATAQPTV